MHHNHAPIPGSSGDLGSLPQGLRPLVLDEPRLYEVAGALAAAPITREQLRGMSAHELTRGNPILSYFFGYVRDSVQQIGADYVSFSRGGVLVLHLIGQASDSGVAPKMESGAMEFTSQYMNPRTMKTIADTVLAAQEALSSAFDEALAGMPQGTDRDMARFGAGVITLGLMAPPQFSQEAWALGLNRPPV